MIQKRGLKIKLSQNPTLTHKLDDLGQLLSLSEMVSHVYIIFMAIN